MRMISFIKRLKAFSLTELLIVLVIVAVLFAALAPIMTKRRGGDSLGDEPVWLLVNNDEQRDAFYDPGQRSLTSTAFFGLEPRSVGANLQPYSKTVIKANKNQNMIQFRYGAESDGTLTGLLTFDNQGNLLHVNKLQGSSANNYNKVINNSKYNTVAGSEAFTKVDKAGGTVAIGSNAVRGGGNNPARITAVGANAGQYAGGASDDGDDSVFVGTGSGRGKSTLDGKRISSSVALGSGVLGIDTSSGSNNVFAGHNVSTAGILSTGAEKNTIINQPLYYGEYPVENTIVGYYSYTGGDSDVKAVTAVGYNACSSMSAYVGTSGTGKTRGGSRTCLGYGSAMGMGTSVYTVPTSFVTDKYDHIYLGGTPEGFGGQSVLEVHNINTTPSLSALPRVGPTVVLNSNLVVRGGMYFPRSDSNTVQSVAYDSLIPSSGKVQNQDYCSHGCLGRKKWRGKNGCKVIADFFNFAFNALVIGGAIWGAISGITGGAVWSPGSWISKSFAPSNGGRWRSPDPPSGSAWVFSGSTSLNCSNSGVCPDLKVKTSDRRLKADIYTNKDALDKIMYVMPYNYTYKADKDNTPQVGVIAQDLEKYLPNSVSKDDKGYLSIRWDELFYVTINSVKALDAKITGLNSSVDLVEKDSAMLAKEQKSTKNRIKEISKRIDKLEK